MKKYPLVLLFVLFSLAASAQKYRTAVGARLGRNDFGISLQQQVLDRNTLEGIFAVGSRDATGTVLFEHHFPILGKGFNYYLGAGAHVGTLKDHGAFFGGDVILGTELKLPIFPLVLSFDVKPAMHVHHEDWFDFASGFTLRYILVKEKKEKKKFGIFGGKQEDNRKKKPGIFGGRQEDNPKKKSGIFGGRQEESRKKKFGIFGGGQEEKNRGRNKDRNEAKKKGWFGL